MSPPSPVPPAGPAAAPAVRPNPFVGPVPFTAADAGYFFGRDYEADELAALVTAERVVLLYSPSGAGKTSVIQARLIPDLEAQEYPVPPVIRVGRDRPGVDSAVPGLPNRYVESALRSVGWLPVPGAPMPTLRAHLDGLAAPDETKGQILIFDQLEEVFTLNPGDLPAKQQFFEQLGEVLAPAKGAGARPARRALLVIREEYLGALDPYLPFLPCRPATFRMNLLDQRRAMAAVQGPAGAVGTPVSDAAAAAVFRRLSQRTVVRPGGPEVIESSFIDPVHLQIVCREIWSELPAAQTAVTPADFLPPPGPAGGDRVDQIDRALTRYYRKAVAAAAARGRVSVRDIRMWIDKYLITYQGLRGTYLIDPSIPPSPPILPEPARQALETACVIRSEDRNGIAWLELAHDRLVRPVKADNDAWFEANLKPVQKAADLWQKASPEQKPNYLLRGLALAQGEAWALANPGSTTDTDRAFLKASRSQWAWRQRRTALGLGLTALVILLLGLAVFLYQQQKANRQINANNFAARAQLAAATDAELSLLYAAGALRLQGRAAGGFPAADEETPNRAAREVAKQVLGRAGGRSLLGHTGPVTKVDVTDRWVITASSDGTVRLWDVANVSGKDQLAPAVVLGKHTKAVTWTALTQDRTRLATVSVDQRLCVWRLDGPPAGREMSPEWFSAPTGNTLSRVAFFPADEPAWVCAAGQGGSVFFWRLDGRAGGEKVEPDVTAVNAHSGRVSAIGVVPGEKGVTDYRVLVTSGGNDVRVWRLDDLERAPRSVQADAVSLRIEKAHEQGVTDVALFWLAGPGPADGPKLWFATSGNDKVIRLWRMADILDPGPDSKKAARTIRGYPGGIVDIAVSQPGAAGKLLVSGDADGGVYVLRLTAVLAGPVGPADTLTLPDSKDAKADPPWVAARPPAPTADDPPVSDRSSITDIDVSPEAGAGTWVTASAESGAIEVMEVLPGEVRNRRTIYPGGGVRAISFGRGPAPNTLLQGGRLLLISAGEDEVARVWDLKDKDGLDWDIEHLKIDTAPESRAWKRAAVFNRHTNAELLDLCRQVVNRRLGAAGVRAHLDKLRADGFQEDADLLEGSLK